MSLLSAVKFVPKEDRDAPSSRNNRKESARDKHGKRSKHKLHHRSSDDESNEDSAHHKNNLKKKHKKEHKHEKKRHRKQTSSSSSSSESDESEVDINQIARDEEDKERKLLEEERKAKSVTAIQDPKKQFLVPLNDDFSYSGIISATTEDNDSNLPSAISKKSNAIEESDHIRKELLLLKSQYQHFAKMKKTNVPPVPGANKSNGGKEDDNTPKLTLQEELQQMLYEEKYGKHAGHSSQHQLEKKYLKLLNKFHTGDGENETAGDKAGIDEEDQDRLTTAYQESLQQLHGQFNATQMQQQMQQQLATEKKNMEKTRDTCYYCKFVTAATTTTATCSSTNLEIVKKKVNKEEKEGEEVEEEKERIPFHIQNQFLLLSKSEHLILKFKDPIYSIAPYHLELFPRQHNTSRREDEYEEMIKEIIRYQQCIAYWFEVSLGKNMIWCETANTAGSSETSRFGGHHWVIDILPFEKVQEAEIQMFFKEAFLTCEEEWSTHKPLLTLSSSSSSTTSIATKKDLYHVIPIHFPYLYVEWFDSSSSTASAASSGLQSKGYVHVLEHTKKSIARSYCYDILAGIFEVDAYRLRKGKRIYDMPKRKEEIDSRKEDWSHYDWTLYLNDNMMMTNEE